MKRVFAAVLFSAIALAQPASLTNYTAAQSAANPGFMLAAFRTNLTPFTKNFEILFSQDTVSWTIPTQQTYSSTPCVSSPVSGCVRDPDIGKFGSTYWVPYTCTDAAAGNFCLTSATATDLLASLTSGTSATWSTTKVLSFSLAGAAIFAPNWVRNYDNTVFLDSAAVGCTANTTPHITATVSDIATFWKIYELHPLDHCTDLANVVAWSVPVQLVTTGDSTLVLDPFVMCIHGSVASPNGNCTGSGDTFYMWYIHLITSTSEFIQYSSASTLTGTYTKISTTGDWMALGGLTQEGPHVLCRTGFPNTCTDWEFYYDNVVGLPGDLITGQLNTSHSSDNWATWSHPQPILSTLQAKHGTMITFP